MSESEAEAAIRRHNAGVPADREGDACQCSQCAGVLITSDLRGLYRGLTFSQPIFGDGSGESLPPVTRGPADAAPSLYDALATAHVEHRPLCEVLDRARGEP